MWSSSAFLVALAALAYGAKRIAPPTYMGCFEDSSDRLLDGAREDSDALTPNSCIDFCYSRRFQLAGVEYGKECFCGDELKGKVRQKDTDCDKQCSGDPTRVCGGNWRLGVYNTGLRLGGGVKAKYMGCHIDPSIKSRLMKGYQKNFRGRMTNTICNEYCKDLGFKYAGSQWSFECFCSNTRPTYKSRTNEDECNRMCDGNRKEMCGGSLRLSVYDLTGDSADAVISNYEGCYQAESGMWQDARRSDSQYMTPEACMSFCYKNGHRYAGATLGNSCQCGDTLEGKEKEANEQCNIPCQGDSALMCGGIKHVSVYNTGIPGEALKPAPTFVGCYEDSEERMLNGQATPSSLLTLEFCTEFCFRKSYIYAGLEYGFECYCGDTIHQHREVSDTECKSPCRGNVTQKCGDSWRLSVYKTGINVPDVPPIEITNSQPAPLLPQPQPPSKDCMPSETQLYSVNLCKGQTIFNDQFIGQTLNKKKWSNSVYMPLEPDFEFVVFNDDPKNIYIKDEKLFIKPTIMSDEEVRRGALSLENCTGKNGTEECERQAELHNVLPPVMSARVHTKDSFAFRYGKVQIRARLPVGDWIVPEIWLQPKDYEYGPDYASGRIRIALARGNSQLKVGDWDIGGDTVESGILVGLEEQVQGRVVEWKIPDGEQRKFHNFTLIWTPDNLSFSVDDLEPLKLLGPDQQKLSQLLSFEEPLADTWKNGTAIAPFDQEFYISLGVSVGGVRDFPDNSTSGSYAKPWENMQFKSMAKFWRARDKWYPTWKDEDSALQIESVTVTAL